MTCVQSLCRSFIRPLNSSECSRRIVPWNDQNPSTSFYKAGRKRLVIMKSFLRQRNLGIEVPLLSAGRFDGCKNVKPKNGNKKGENIAGASSGANVETTNVDETEQGKSGVYSCNMTQAMGAVLTYKHELGMNYNFVLPDLIVGSCLQNPADVDKLRDMGVGTIFCLQQDPDLEYFGVDITAIEARAKEYDGLQHIRAEIRDFDPFDLRMQLPIVVSKLHKVARNGHGIIYVHCTAGLGRAPAVVIAYMFWVRGYKLLEANKLLQSVRPCFPKLEAIKSATADMLIGDSKQRITLKLHKGGCTSVEISGLDIGWGQRIPLAYNEKHGCWVLQRELPEGYYEYKYIIDGNWTYNPDELVTSPNKDGHANNYIEVRGDHLDDTKRNLRWRLMQEDVDLTEGERQIIFERLEALADAKQPRI